MSGLPLLERSLWFAGIACYAILLVRMAASRLHRTYRVFFIYLLVRLGRSLLLVSLPRGTNLYGWTFVATEPVIWTLHVLVLLELYSLVFRDYPGIHTLGRWLLIGGMMLATFISIATLFPDLSNPAERYPILLYMNVAQRAVISSLLLFLLLLTGFLVWYPVPLSRNIVVYCAGYCVYFVGSTLGLLIRNITGYTVTRTTSTVLQGVYTACLVAWIVLLSPKGEAKRVVLRQHLLSTDEDRLIGHLDALNRTLLKTARE